MVEPHVTVLSHPDDSVNDQLLCTRVGQKLWDHYPGWSWHVDIPPNQNVVIVRNLTISHTKPYGFVIYKDRITAGMAEIVKAGGEFLERWNIRRAAMEAARIEGRRFIFEKPQI